MDGRLVIWPGKSLQSIAGDIGSRLKNVNSSGFCLVEFEEKDDKLETDMLVISSIVGRELSRGFGYHFLTGESDDNKLAAHTEGISYSSGIIPFFTLGCVRPSEIGGETRIFDARMAARLVFEHHPSLAKVVIEYSSLANRREGSFYPLVVCDRSWGNVLMYRAKVETNKIIGCRGYGDEEVYHIIDEILEKCVVLKHNWRQGDMLFVNNRITLHDRLPFQGTRRMLRVRFDDPLNQRISY
jgi:hypothetical protein